MAPVKPKPEMIVRVSPTRAFTRFAGSASDFVAHPLFFVASCATVVLWIATGPLFRWNDAWQLIINDITNILSLVLLCLIANAQKREGDATQLKLDELIAATKHADNRLLDIEELEDEELDLLKQQYAKLAAEARHAPVVEMADTQG